MVVEKNPDEISTIRDLLAEHAEGLPIKSISETLGMNRNSVAKYLDMLQMAGRVTLKRIGTAKIYCIANKMPVSAVLKLTKSHVIIFNQMLTAADINDSFTTLLKIPKKEILGKTLDHLPFAVQSQPALLTLIKDGIRGTESKTSASIKIGNRNIPCTLTISPTFFENGQNGVSLIIDFIQEQVNGEIADNGKGDLPGGFEGIEYVCRFTVDGTLTYVNRAYSVLLQKTQADLIGQNWRPPIPDVEYKKIKSSLLSLDSADPVALEEFKVITPGGDSQWQRWKFRILFDHNGNPEGYQGNGFDITEIKKLEQKVSRITDEIESLKKQRNDEVQDLNKQLYHEIASHEKTNFQLKFTQFAMDNASYMITWIAENGRFVYMNNEAQRVLGYHYRDVISKSFKDIFEGVFPLPWDEIWEVIKQEQQYSFETVLTTSKGIEIPVEMVLNYLEFKGKQYCCCFAKDITKRKTAEETLLENEARLRLSVQSANIGLWDWNLKTNTVYFSPEWKGQLGYRDNEISNSFDEWQNRVHPDDENLALQKVQNFLANPQGRHEIEVRMQHKDGSYRWITALADVLRDADGMPVRMLGCHIDITERKLAEETLRQSRDRFEAILASLDEAVFLVDPVTRRISECNEATARIFGYSHEELDGKVSSFLHVDQAHFEQFGREAMVAYDDPGYYATVFEMQRKDGSIFPSEHFVRPVRDPDGRILYSVSVVRDITERKLAEETLRESEERFRSVIDNSTDVIYRQNLQTRKYEYYSPACAAIYGFSPGEMMAMDESEARARVHPDDRALVDAAMTRLIETDQCHLEVRWQVRSGDYHWLSTTMIILKDKNGQPLYRDGFVRDVTERKMAEEEIKQSEIRYHSLFENMLEGYSYCKILFDQDMPKDFVYIEVNSAFETLTGLKNVSGRKVSEVIPGIHDSNPELLRTYSRVALTGRTEQFETYLPLLDLYLSITVYSQQKGYFIAMFDNITERKRAEESLQLHGEIVQNLAEGVVLISASDGKIVYANPRFESMFGYDANELTGRPISVVNAPCDKSPQTTAEEIINNLEQTGTWSGEVFNIRKDGTTFWCYATVSKFDHPQYGQVWVSVHMDITERKRAEEALRVANKKLNLLSTVTRHDINNQMTIMRGFINRLEREQPEGSFTEYFHKINSSGDQITALIKLTKSYENIGINTTDWQDVSTLVEAAAKDVELGDVRLENEIPGGIELFADPLIAKVFYNLLENAIRHGKTLTKIRFTSKEDAGGLIIFCEDDGVGVAAEDKERIFKRGYSKDTRMSLFVAHEILDITDIRIRETGEPGKGSRFEMTVPKGMHRKQLPGDPV